MAPWEPQAQGTHHIGRGERVSAALPPPGRDHPAEEASGDVAGEASGDVAGEAAGDVAGEDVAGDVAGEVAGDVTGEVAGDVAGEVAGDVAGDVTREVAGDVAGEVAGEVPAEDDRGPVEAGAVVTGAGEEGASDALLNGGRCAVMATMR
jgi:hypothetical protein